jgi:hypothetical protein
MMTDGIAAIDQGERIETRDIAELVAAALLPTAPTAPTTPAATAA